MGYVGPREAAPILLGGLQRLEYRGYDSAGVATLAGGVRLEVRRAIGKLDNLRKLLHENALDGHIGMGHTRWATHGRPSEINAHPHQAGPVVPAPPVPLPAVAGAIPAPVRSPRS